MDRLSPLSIDSGFDSMSSPNTPDNLQTRAAIESDNMFPLTATASIEAALPLATVGESTSFIDFHKTLLEINKLESLVCDVSPGCYLKEEEEESQVVPCASDSSPDHTDDKESIPIVTDVCTEEASTSTKVCSEEKTEESGDEEEVGPRWPCEWEGCSGGYENVDELYDHLVEIHVRQVEQENPDVTPDEVACSWGKCSMSVTRGDRTKKFHWLLEHIKSRHAQKARPFKCLMEGCSQRFYTVGKMDGHVRAQHINEPKKVKSAPTPKPETWCGFRSRTYWPKRLQEECWTRFYDHQLQIRLITIRDMEEDFEFVCRKRPGTGSAHRKAYGPFVEDIVPLKRKKLTEEEDVEQPEVIDESERPEVMDEVEDEEENDQEDDTDKLTLDDLFPGWNYASTARERREEAREERLRQHKRRRARRQYEKFMKRHPEQATKDDLTTTETSEPVDFCPPVKSHARRV